ncbi:MAG TPA: T9SS type A sorting domain-containing protein [Bacteroidia bacterium]|nr:T9SS type A sorting domain-containing protein [Bacteroidia bacterium]
MKKISALFVFVCMARILFAQNLVANGDFEGYTGTCPTYSPNGAFIQVIGWKPPNAMPVHGVPHAELYCNGTPNYGNCLPGPVPNAGTNGPAYVGFHTRNISPVYNEAIYQVLPNALTTGNTYTISFDLMNCQSGLFILGSSDFCVYTNIDTVIPGCPTTNPSVTLVGCVPFDSISNVSWKHHSFSFAAPPNSNVLAFSGAACFTTDIYYYLDNVELMLSTSLPDAQQHVKGTIFKNIFSESTIYSFDYQPKNIYSFEIMDCNGKLVRQCAVKKGEIAIEKNNLAAGMYFYRLNCNNKIADKGKLVVQ